MSNSIAAATILEFILNDEGLHDFQITIEWDLKQLYDKGDYTPYKALEMFRDLINTAIQAYSITVEPSSISNKEINAAAEECRDAFETGQGL